MSADVTDREASAYLLGYLDALWSYAHWKDGTAYVGSTGRTHKEAAEWARANVPQRAYLAAQLQAEEQIA